VKPTREAVVAAARRVLGPGISEYQALLIGYAEVTGEPLDPYSFDDAAILLRAERLLHEGFVVPDALRSAREECVTWSVR
jgi:hypothetical protein